MLDIQIKLKKRKFYKYCPVVYNPGGMGGSDLCTKDSQCKSHVYKHNINDNYAITYENPFESDDIRGYHRIEDESVII